MAKLFVPKVATSNHLIEGDVIYYARPGWTRLLAEAAVALDEAEAQILHEEASAFQHETVGVELVDVELADNIPFPAHFRETFRTRGPSNYFHGKQAEHV